MLSPQQPWNYNVSNLFAENISESRKNVKNLVKKTSNKKLNKSAYLRAYLTLPPPVHSHQHISTLVSISGMEMGKIQILIIYLPYYLNFKHKIPDRSSETLFFFSKKKLTNGEGQYSNMVDKKVQNAEFISLWGRIFSDKKKYLNK